jgi:hypothetical protein
MKLDYSIPQFQLLIGNFNATDYLDEIALSLPMHEITQKLSWSGRFKVSFNRKAIAQGLTADQFDQGATPGRWRPGQQPVRLYIKGYPLPVMRIDRYAYNPQTGIGEGSLHQIIDAVATDRPATKGEIEIYYTPLDAIVNSLLSVAFRESAVNPGWSVGGLAGQLLGGFVTRNPIADAQKLLGTQWQTLTVDTSEVTRSHYCGLNNALFSRTLNQIEIEPDIDHINFAASRIIVTGSRQVPKEIKPTPGQPKPKLQKTEEVLPYIDVYPGIVGTRYIPVGSSGSYSSVTTLLGVTLAEKKRVHYQYKDDARLDFDVFSDLFGKGVSDLVYDLQRNPRYYYSNNPIIVPSDPNKPYQVVTIKEWPRGRISSIGEDHTFEIAEVIQQTETRRRTWVPKLLVVPTVAGQPEDYSLVLKKDEKLTTPPTTDNSNQGNTTDPRTGKPTILEPKPIIEGQKPIADQPMETEPVLGVAQVSPAGWSPIAPNDQIIEVGFLPDANVATQLANNIAVREARRRDSMAVTMPIPDEWLVAGCPILPTVALWDGVWLAEGLIVSMQGTEAKFAFTAARISRAGVPVYREVINRKIRAAAFVRVQSLLRLGNPIEGQAGGTTIPIEGQEGGTTILIEQN